MESKEELLRRSGRSTRLLDNYIQKLFSVGFVVIKDHVSYNTRKMNLLLLNKFIDRLRFEHFRGELKDFIKVNRREFRVELKNFKVQKL